MPVTIAIVLAAIGVLNLAGVNIGRTLTWVLQPLVLVAGGLVTGLQVFAANYIRRSFNKATDPSLCEIDVASFMDAA